MQKDTSHIRVRIDPARLARLEKSADQNGRTLSGEIIHRLDTTFAKDDLAAFADKLSHDVTLKVTQVLKRGTALTVSNVRKGEKP
jgi:hypothetical protein